MTRPESTPEMDMRDRLGIPRGSELVVCVCESSHWDPNWMLRSTEYMRLLVRRTLDRAIGELMSQPRRRFGLESVFFPDLYLRQQPEMSDVFRDLVEQRRLYFSGCGVTTPDTLLPSEEVLLRDLLIGQEWLRGLGVSVEPRTLYLPDSFGHSPALPSILDAAGIGNVAFHRIDGMFFAGGETDPSSSFPRRGSSAAMLTDETGADFVWRAPDGSQVLAHWLAHGYGHGDMIASGGITRTLQLPLSWPDRRPARVGRRIDRYIEELSSSVRTPYLLLAVGHDFVRPVHDLVGLLDEWNAVHFERNGVWMVNTSIDEYFALLSTHRDRLPVVDLDPNPCWTGFYASRPSLKSAVVRLHGSLIAADHRHAIEAIGGSASGDRSTPHEAWWTGVLANHHDFITGTSTDRVVLGEQRPGVDKALTVLACDDVTDRTIDNEETDGGSAGPHDRVVVELDWATATFDATAGGALTTLVDPSGNDLLRGPALELRSHRDSGGLWRMGHEFRGGRWQRWATTTTEPARVQVSARTAADVTVTVDTTLERRPVTIRSTLSLHEQRIVVETIVSAPNRRTVSLVVPFSHDVDHLEMHQPGGLVRRPLSRGHAITYWPLHSFVHLITADADGGADDDRHVPQRSRPTGGGSIVWSPVVATAAPTAVHVEPTGEVDVVVARTAVKELAWRTVPILAPVWGRRFPAHRSFLVLEWAKTGAVPSSPGIEDGSDLPAGLRAHRAARRRAGIPTPRWAVHSSDPAVEIIAVKQADRGSGTIVRLRAWNCGPSGRVVRITLDPSLGRRIERAWSSDSRERDICPLVVDDGGIDLRISRHLSTIRIITGDA